MQKNVFNVLMTMGLGLSVSAMAKTPVHAPEARPGEIIVKLKKGASKSLFAQKSLMGAEVARELNVQFGNLAVLKVSNTKSLNGILKTLNSDPRIEYAEPNFIYRAGKVSKESYTQNFSALNNLTNDPMVGSLWGLQNTGSNEPKSNGQNSSPFGVQGADLDIARAWAITKGSKKVKIAVIDTGVDYNHPDLKNNIWVNQAELNGKPGVDDDKNGIIDDVYGARFENGVGSGNPMDGNGHGTHCSGTIAAVHNNGVGVAGVMADAEIMGVKFLTDDGSGSSADAIMAIDYATRMGVDIMSNSWGGGGASQALEDAIRAANDAGIIFTAAAGNDGTNNDVSPHYPSNYDVPNVISVAAHNYADKVASFSCYGKNTVHVAAPGRNILSTVPNNGYAVYSGTSMATPHVTGVVGLFIANQGRMTPSDLRERLMATTEFKKSYGTKTLGGGRVNAYNFLTNTRPVRDIPQENEWLSDYTHAVESTHPYAVNANDSVKITIPGAKYVRVVLERYEFEKNYDFLEITNPASSEVLEKVTGAGLGYKTDYVEGETIELVLKSDYSETRWGYSVKEVQYILK